MRVDRKYWVTRTLGKWKSGRPMEEVWHAVQREATARRKGAELHAKHPTFRVVVRPAASMRAIKVYRPRRTSHGAITL